MNIVYQYDYRQVWAERLGRHKKRPSGNGFIGFTGFTGLGGLAVLWLRREGIIIELKQDYLITVFYHLFGGVASVKDQPGVIDDPLVVVGGVVGHDHGDISFFDQAGGQPD